MATISALLIIFAGAPANEFSFDQSHLTAQKIIDHAIARADAQYESMVEAMFESVVISTISSLDGDGEIAKTDRTKRRQYPLHGALFEELIEKNGRPLTDEELLDEEKKRRDFIREVEQRISRGEHPQPEREPGIRFNREFVERYQLTLEESETIRGHRCWVIRFEPKQGKLPVRNRMDRALNQSTGRFWVSQDDYGLARVEFALREPFKYWGGFLAVIRNTEGSMDYRRVEPNIWMPSRFSLKLDLKVMMVKNIRRLITIDYTGYRRSDDLSVSLGTVPKITSQVLKSAISSLRRETCDMRCGMCNAWHFHASPIASKLVKARAHLRLLRLKASTSPSPAFL